MQTEYWLLEVLWTGRKELNHCQKHVVSSLEIAMTISDFVLSFVYSNDPVSNMMITQVRLQCGARVQDVVEALRPHGLTLQNFASIREQQIGGFTQVCLLCCLVFEVILESFVLIGSFTIPFVPTC